MTGLEVCNPEVVFPGSWSVPRADLRMKCQVDRGQLVNTVELNHLSLIFYSVPSSRILTDLPAGVKMATSKVNGVEMAWISTISGIDGGLGGVESTTYRLHVVDGAMPAHLLLGVSIGSLSPVGARNLWQMPWHLGAMELQAAFDPRRGCYTSYRLQTQSQWENACWEINDTGNVVTRDDQESLGVPFSVLSEQVKLLYSRTDQPGDITSGMDVVYGGGVMTLGEIRTARSEFLERAGFLTREELANPSIVLLQQRATLQLAATSIGRHTGLYNSGLGGGLIRSNSNN